MLCYHRVLPAATGVELPDYSVTPQQFASQMSLLRDEGFISLTLDEYFQIANGSRVMPSRSVVVTFDDGFADNYSIAWPIAKRFGIKLNLFICTGFISGAGLTSLSEDNPRATLSRKTFPEHWQPLSWSQLREMMAAGVVVGFHSHYHRNLGQLTEDEIASDTAHGVSVFKEQLGAAPQFFAFPYGHYGSYPETALTVLTAQGMKMLFTTELGRTPLGGAQRLFSRIVVHPEDDLSSFRRKLFGGYDWVGRMRKFIYLSRAALRSDARRLARV